MNDKRPSAEIFLSLDPFERLVATLPGMEPLSGLFPVRCFPLTAPNEFISLVDRGGREVYCIQNLDELASEAKTLLLAELERCAFIPKINRILYISPESEPTTWRVETDRGRVEFVLPNEDSVRRLDTKGALVTDRFGVRYHIPEIARLDGRSRKRLLRYL